MCKGCHYPQRASLVPSLSLEYRGGPFLKKQRSVEPEIFTFDPIAEVKRPAPANARTPGRRRAVKVLYPAQVRKYLPPKKKDWVKRILLLFLSIVVVQVYGATETDEEVVNAAALPVAPVDVTRSLPTNGSALLMSNLPVMEASGDSSVVGIPQGRVVECVGRLSGGNGSSPQRDSPWGLPNQLYVVLALCGVRSWDVPKFSAVVQ
ncbi:radiation-inducible immediate-early gene IEX-1-like [Pristis pectinata]|uniref:radiation-inducible immediate-early gene IEX-1-like n=1 Tax=Pristis pectinata TaxID=685728 RepID=UPI00223D6D3F|nr:radiation-inducible immediate-early gene IEX-1-like [Pristis pectinata]